MRTKTLLTICFLFALIYLNFSELPWWPENRLASFAVRLIANLIILPLLLLALFKGNARWQQWRKLRGRDLDEEEKHETDSGTIQLGLEASTQEDRKP